MALFHYRESFPGGKHTKLLKKKKWSHRMSCTSLSWPATRLQSQAGQPWSFAYVKNRQLHYACTGPVKAQIIMQLKQIPPSNACIYQFRSPLDSCVNLSSRNDLSSVSPETYMTNTRQYSWHFSISASLSSYARPAQSITTEWKRKKLWRGPSSTLLL